MFERKGEKVVCKGNDGELDYEFDELGYLVANRNGQIIQFSFERTNTPYIWQSIMFVDGRKVREEKFDLVYNSLADQAAQMESEYRLIEEFN